ncbi:MAG: metallophosphoesterase [Clostridia bacterium]|nr:metallophosphoesterase [Clostridia bacterium]
MNPLSFTVITDVHYYSKELGVDTKSYNKINAASQILIKNSSEVIEAAFAQIAKSPDEIVLICGDTTRDGDYESHIEFIDMLRALQKCGKRVYALTSTHDYKDDGITYKYTSDVKEEIPAAKREELFDMYYESGPSSAVAVYPQGLSYVADLDGDTRLFAINSDKDGTGRSGFSPEHREWIKEQAEIAKALGKRMIAITHHPIISPSSFYTIIGRNNIMNHNDEVADMLADLGINLVFSGHTHIHDISYRFSEKGNVIYDVSTSALTGYPGYMRRVMLVGDDAYIKSKHITEPVKGELDGKDLQEVMTDQFFGMVRRTVESAAGNMDTFADCANAISIPKKAVYKFGWLIKPVVKLLNNLTVGKVAKMTKAEHGLEPAEYADIADEKVIDFIIDLATHLYAGDSPYNPDTAYYKITVSVAKILDSILSAVHISFGKIVKGFNSAEEVIKPLLYNSGICDKEAQLKLNANEEDVKNICCDEFCDSVRNSKKGKAIVALLVLLIIILIPLIPAIALIVGAGFAINYIKYHKTIRGLKK